VVGDAVFERSIDLDGAGELVKVHATFSPSRRSITAERSFTDCDPPFGDVTLHAIESRIQPSAAGSVTV
jgi:hypothetical protein